MTVVDLLNFNQCNLDELTETYSTSFYLDYLAQWPQLCQVLEDEHGMIEGYRMWFALFPKFRLPRVSRSYFACNSLASHSPLTRI